MYLEAQVELNLKERKMSVDIKYLEKLSKLEINEQSKEKFEKDFEKILDFVGQITCLDLPEEDKSRFVKLNDLRDDVIKDSETVDVLLNAPKKKDGCYVTPLVVE